MKLDKLTEIVREHERDISYGSETYLWGRYAEWVRAMTGYLPWDDDMPEDIEIDDDEAVWWEAAYKQENVLALQEEKLAAELKRYEYGRSDTDTVIRYQDDLLLSRILYMQSILDYKAALIELALKENTLLDSFWKDTL